MNRNPHRSKLAAYLLASGILPSPAQATALALHTQRSHLSSVWLCAALVAVVSGLTNFYLYRRFVSPQNRLKQKIETLKSQGQLQIESNSIAETIDALNEQLVATHHELRTLRFELQHHQLSKQLRAQYLASMSHEVRNQLDSLVGLSFLFDQTLIDPAQKQNIQRIKESGESALDLIDGVMDLSALEEGNSLIETVQFNLEEMLDSLNRKLRPHALQKKLKFEIQVDKATFNSTVKADLRRIQNVLSNLLLNSIRMTEEGTVSLKVLKKFNSEISNTQKGKLEFTIQDDGPGIPDHLWQRIFKKSTNVNPLAEIQTSTIHPGLLIAQQLIEHLNGSIEVFGFKKKGNLIEIQIPVDLVESTTVNTPEPKRQLRVLVAEDDAFQRDLVVEICHQFAWHVDSVSNGLQAVKVILQNRFDAPYDLAVLDWNMPELTGIEVVNELHKKLKTTDMPATLLLSMYSAEEMLESQTQSRIDGLISKPVKPSKLFNAANKALLSKGYAQDFLLSFTEIKNTPIKWLQGVRVLIVEDHELNLLIVKAILEKQGAMVYGVSDGLSALNWLADKSHEIDLILMDIKMPLMNGNDAAQAIRSETRLCGLPIVAISAVNQAEAQELIEEGQIDAFLPKPIKADQLIHLVRWHVEKSHQKNLTLIET